MNVILIVEDQEDILFNLQMTLEFNGYEVETAKNGKEALNFLSSIIKPPDLIISDILMPEVNGYELFKEISEHPLFFHIPFIFLTARTSPEDVRFGKMLGVDDYITKPFNNEDLLATIAGKLARREKNEKISKMIEERLISLLNENTGLLPSYNDYRDIILLLVQEDENNKLDLKISLPNGAKPPFSIEELGNQLYTELIKLNGQNGRPEPQLLRVKSIERDVYAYFDCRINNESRGVKKKHMFAVIAPKISYLNSIRLKELFYNLSTRINEGKKWDTLNYYKKIHGMLKL